MPSDTGKKRRAINKRINQMVNDMSERHSRVCVTRIDITYPEEIQSDGSNKDIIRLNNNLRSFMDRNNIDFEYVTVREQVDSHNPHYHSIFCTDGSKLSKPKRLQETSNEIWKGIVGSEKNGLVHYPKNNRKHKLPPLQMLKRPLQKAEGEDWQRQQDKYEKAKSIAKQHGEYLAKEYSKGVSSEHREVFSSQVKRKKK